MTASRSPEHWLSCNGWYGEDGTYQYCGTQFRDPPDADHFARPAELRRLAAKEGWLFERSPRSRTRGKDRCPACVARHSAAGYAAALAVIRSRVEADLARAQSARNPEPATGGNDERG